MKKNGFTMVELLAVLVIVGILSTISVTAYSHFTERATKTSYENFEKSLKNAAIDYFVEHTTDLPKVGEDVAISASTLIRDGYLDSMKDPKTGGKAKTCDKKSYIVIRQKSSKNGYNLNLKYEPCIICAGYQSSSCQETKPSPMK